jgi:hypothetical protein
MSGGAAAAAAAAAAARRRQEEEEMTRYSENDLSEGWEFKILRSNMNAFRKPENLKKYLEEEGRAGWVLVEKFDDNRLRLKRPASAVEETPHSTSILTGRRWVCPIPEWFL